MGRYGVNPKVWFYGFNQRLAEHPNIPLASSAAPQLNVGSPARYGYLAETLPDDLTCYVEDHTTDLTIYDVRETDGVRTGAWEQGRIASIEVKLVYRSYSEPRVDNYATTLCSQVHLNRTRGSTLNVGYIFGVYTRWPSKTPRVRGEFPEFRRTVSRRIREVCDTAGVPCAKPALEAVIAPIDVRIRGGDGAVRPCRAVCTIARSQQ